VRSSGGNIAGEEESLPAQESLRRGGRLVVRVEVTHVNARAATAGGFWEMGAQYLL